VLKKIHPKTEKDNYIQTGMHEG